MDNVERLKTIKSVDSRNFVKMVEMGVKNLKKHYQEVNDLNVFPVPDGDTGINMRRTIETGYDAIKDIEKGPLSETVQKMARGALLGARGNSGVILSQIFRGFANGVGFKKTVSVYGLHTAFRAAVKQAYSAVNNPVEGTILTVLRESVKYASKFLTGSVLQYLKALVKQAKITLDNTINMMDVLKEAGVVDSGGAGYYYIIQGFEFYFDSVNIDEIDSTNMSAYEEAIPHEKPAELDLSLFNEDSVLDYGYCTEFILQLQTSKVGNVSEFSEQEVISYLETQGDSIVCFKDGSIVKTHVHTKDPGAVLSHVRCWGEFLTVKIENMSLQHNNVIAKEMKSMVERMTTHKRVASVAVCQGEGIKNAFKEVGVDMIVDGNQTMNPSSEDFVDCFNRMDADNIIVLPNNSNIIMAAEQAKELYEKENPNVNIVVIKTKSVSQGFIAANMFVFDDEPIDKIEKDIYASIEDVTSIEITTATRNTTVSGVKVTKDHYIGIMNHSLKEDNKDKVECLINTIKDDESRESKENILVIYGKDATKEDKVKLEEALRNVFPSLDLSEVDGGQDVYDFNVAIF